MQGEDAHQTTSTRQWPQRLAVLASEGAGRWGTRRQGQRGQGRGCGLFLASVHLGFHEQRLPLLRGHCSPLLLLLEVLLLGQQHFLGVHTCLEEEGQEQSSPLPSLEVAGSWLSAPFLVSARHTLSTPSGHQGTEPYLGNDFLPEDL